MNTRSVIIVLLLAFVAVSRTQSLGTCQVLLIIKIKQFTFKTKSNFNNSLCLINSLAVWPTTIPISLAIVATLEQSARQQTQVNTRTVYQIVSYNT